MFWSHFGRACGAEGGLFDLTASRMHDWRWRPRPGAAKRLHLLGRGMMRCVCWCYPDHRLHGEAQRGRRRAFQRGDQHLINTIAPQQGDGIPRSDLLAAQDGAGLRQKTTSQRVGKKTTDQRVGTKTTDLPSTHCTAPSSLSPVHSLLCR